MREMGELGGASDFPERDSISVSDPRILPSTAEQRVSMTFGA